MVEPFGTEIVPPSAWSSPIIKRSNVDGLHERSEFPSDRLINIHGTDSMVECMSCRRSEPRERIQAIWESGVAAPRCDCGGPWKPATISFGQNLVAEDLQRAAQVAESCDLFVAAGTSLVVGPINQMCPIAHRAGAATAILTASETPYDEMADYRITDPIEEVLPLVRDTVLST